ncbi:MAG: phosphohistidine phosphatase [Psychromonas sp.]|jgi:phosphohistidine phosphatase
MKLHLIRHAKTEKSSASGKDFDRKLQPIGRNQAQDLSTFLLEKIPLDSKVICSTASRTEETLDAILHLNVFTNIEKDKSLYLCSRAYYLECIWSESGNNDLVFVGHNFGISDLATYFLEEEIPMRTGEYICIEFDIDTWSEAFRGNGGLVNRYRSGR